MVQPHERRRVHSAEVGRWRAVALCLAVGGCGEEPARPAAVPERPVPRAVSLLDGLPADASGVELFERAASVMLHPRCSNCHPTSDRPQQRQHAGDEPRPHAMLVARGEDGRGTPALRCPTCHQRSNAIGTRAPPGAEGWHLAPTPMGWDGHSPGQLCRQLLDPTRTGGRDVEAIIEHIGHDPLVAWAWDPGHGREAAPGSKQELVGLLRRWASAGTPCPGP